MGSGGGVYWNFCGLRGGIARTLGARGGLMPDLLGGWGGGMLDLLWA